MKQYMLLSFVALLGFTACSTDSEWADGQPGSGKEVVVRAAIGHDSLVTRTMPEADDALDQAKFTAGDLIRIYAGMKNADYVLDTDGRTWRPAMSGDVLTWDKQNMTFNAYYPVNVTDQLFPTWFNSLTFGCVQIDQTTKEGLAHSDYMTATKIVEEESDDHALSLTFERMTARVVVEIAGYNDQFNASDNPVTGVAVHGFINSRYKETPPVFAYNVTTGGQPGSGTKFVALLFPTVAFANSAFIDVTVSGQEQPLHVTGIPELVAGNSYAVKLIVGKNRAQVESITVSPWSEGSPIPGGEATERPEEP